MIEKITFIITFAVMYLTSVRTFSIIFGRGNIVFPQTKHISPDSWYIFYPSLLYQIYWWFTYFKII